MATDKAKSCRGCGAPSGIYTLCFACKLNEERAQAWKDGYFAGFRNGEEAGYELERDLRALLGQHVGPLDIEHAKEMLLRERRG